MDQDIQKNPRLFLRDLFENSRKNQPEDDAKSLLKLMMRQGVVSVDPADGFFVDQGCLAISQKSLITGGLGPCVAVAIRQAGRPHLLAHMDSTGFREHTIEEIAATIKDHFDPAAADFEIEVHNWKAHDTLKQTVMDKVSELTAALGRKPEDIRYGIPFVTPIHTIQLNCEGKIASGLKGQELQLFLP